MRAYLPPHPNPLFNQSDMVVTGPLMMEYNYQGRTLPHLPVCPGFKNAGSIRTSVAGWVWNWTISS